MDTTTDTITVLCKRGFKRDKRHVPAGTILDVSREEFEAVNARSPGLLVLPGSEPDPVAEAEAAKAARDAVHRAEKLRRIEAAREQKRVEAEKLAAFLRQHQTAQEAQAARKAEAESILAERKAARKARAQGQAQV